MSNRTNSLEAAALALCVDPQLLEAALPDLQRLTLTLREDRKANGQSDIQVKVKLWFNTLPPSLP